MFVLFITQVDISSNKLNPSMIMPNHPLEPLKCQKLLAKADIITTKSRYIRLWCTRPLNIDLTVQPCVFTLCSKFFKTYFYTKRYTNTLIS